MKLGHFLEDEAGAVTVDWVVLTAALVGLGLAVTTVVKGGIESKANEIDHFLADDVVIRVAFVEDGISTARDDACALAGTLCDPSLSESGLARLSISQLDALEAQDYAAAYLSDLNGSGSGRTYAVCSTPTRTGGPTSSTCTPRWSRRSRWAPCVPPARPGRPRS